MPQLFANNAVGVLNGSIGTGTSSIALVSSDAFPVPTGDDYFMATLIGLDSEGREDRWEIVKVTSNLLNVLTVERAQEGTEAQGWGSGATIELRVTAMSFDNKANTEQVLTDVPNGAIFTDTVYTHPELHAIAEVDGLQAALDGKASSAQGSNADTAHGWGDHAAVGYASATDVVPVTGGTFTGGITNNATFTSKQSSVTAFRHLRSEAGGLVLGVTSEGFFRAYQAAEDGTLEDIWIGAARNGGVELRYNNTTKIETSSTGVNVTGTVSATGGNSTNWNTAYSWGNHASAGYAPLANPSFIGSFLELGNGGGSVALSINDGHGNANLCFNHLLGVPDSPGSSARIDANVDNTTGSMTFEIGDSVSAGVSVSLTSVMKLTTSLAEFYKPITTTGAITASGGNSGNWNTAYGWGDHASAGYLSSSTTATESRKGIAEIATQAETDAGTDDSRIVTPKKLKAAIPQAFDAGTSMLFFNSAAPTGWTKDTTHNNKALRIVSGTPGSGGSVNFSDAFKSQSVSGTIANKTAGGTVTVNNTTLTLSTIANHSHTGRGSGHTTGNKTGVTWMGNNTNNYSMTNSSGGGGSHGHSSSFIGTAHNHTFSGTTINLAVKYVDSIICTKD